LLLLQLQTLHRLPPGVGAQTLPGRHQAEDAANKRPCATQMQQRSVQDGF